MNMYENRLENRLDEISPAGFLDNTVNPHSDDNKALRKYAGLVRAELRYY